MLCKEKVGLRYTTTGYLNKSLMVYLDPIFMYWDGKPPYTKALYTTRYIQKEDHAIKGIIKQDTPIMIVKETLLNPEQKIH